MGGDAEPEIRQVFDAEDFSNASTSELPDREKRQRVRMEAYAGRGGA